MIMELSGKDWLIHQDSRGRDKQAGALAVPAETEAVVRCGENRNEDHCKNPDTPMLVGRLDTLEGRIIQCEDRLRDIHYTEARFLI